MNYKDVIISVAKEPVILSAAKELAIALKQLT